MLELKYLSDIWNTFGFRDTIGTSLDLKLEI